MLPEHICWSKEPWFAWDLWNEAPGATELFEIMLNGGYALVDASVSIHVEDVIFEDVLPTIAELDPVIEDYLPMLDYHGLYALQIFHGDTITAYENEEDPDFSAVLMPHVTEAKQVLGHGYAAIYRPWNVTPMPHVTEDDAWDEDQLHQWLVWNIENGHPDRVRQEIPALEAMFSKHNAQRRQLRADWEQFLRSMAPRHDCAGLLLDELLNESTTGVLS